MKKMILVPIDFSDVTEEIVNTACDFAMDMDAKLCLFHVSLLDMGIENYMFDVPFVGAIPLGDATEMRNLEARDKLEHWASIVQSKGVDFEWECMQGTPRYSILNKADEICPCCIMIGSHGHGALFHLVMGSVSEYVMHHATCPVMMVHSKPVAAEMPADMEDMKMSRPAFGA